VRLWLSSYSSGNVADGLRLSQGTLCDHRARYCLVWLGILEYLPRIGASLSQATLGIYVHASSNRHVQGYLGE
jgi:hypothetical protein